jgi:hypothetical protein
MTLRRPSGDLPDFLIVGAPKCGTTAMYDYLRQHPDVYMPFIKEPLFFGSDLTSRYGRMTDEEYRALFRDAPDGAMKGEASAWYLYSACAAQEIHDAIPDARIVVMVRNPIEVMHAQHSQLLFSRQEDISDFGEALAAEPDRVEGRRLPPGPIRPENLLYRHMVRFAEQLERYRDAFGRERVHVIVFDDFRDDTAAAYRRLLGFLGLDPEVKVDLGPRNENKRVRAAWLQRLIWDPPVLRPLIPRLRRYPVVHRARQAMLRLNSSRAGRDAIDPQLRARLARELRPEVERLSAMLDRDLLHWVAP